MTSAQYRMSLNDAAVALEQMTGAKPAMVWHGDSALPDVDLVVLYSSGTVTVDDPTFRQLFTASMLQDATKEQIDAFNELQRLSASAESAVRYMETVSEFDVRPLLKQVNAPTLVMHVRDDRRVPIASGREMAAEIPGAKFVTLPGKNHLMLEQDPGTPIFLEEVRNFLSGL